MTSFWGMDTEAVDDFGALLEQDRQTVESRFQDLHSVVSSVIGTQWFGADADAFQSSYSRDVTAQVTSATDRMQSMFEELRQHIEAQDQASSPDSQNASPGAPGPQRPPTPEEKSFWEKFGDKFVENIIPSPLGGVTTLISAVHSLPGWMLENGPKFMPVLGDVYTGLLSGAQRFGNESHLPLGERLGRATLDGVLTGGGSFLGGTIGALGGAFGGVLIGGGSVGAAGTAAGAVFGGGVGAIPGALAGLGAGAIAGGVVGGILGDVVGGYFGSAAGNALASAILD